jgi:hypothetical protein
LGARRGCRDATAKSSIYPQGVYYAPVNREGGNPDMTDHIHAGHDSGQLSCPETLGARVIGGRPPMELWGLRLL